MRVLAQIGPRVCVFQGSARAGLSRNRCWIAEPVTWEGAASVDNASHAAGRRSKAGLRARCGRWCSVGSCASGRKARVRAQTLGRRRGCRTPPHCAGCRNSVPASRGAVASVPVPTNGKVAWSDVVAELPDGPQRSRARTNARSKRGVPHSRSAWLSSRAAPPPSRSRNRSSPAASAGSRDRLRRPARWHHEPVSGRRLHGPGTRRRALRLGSEAAGRGSRQPVWRRQRAAPPGASLGNDHGRRRTCPAAPLVAGDQAGAVRPRPGGQGAIASVGLARGRHDPRPHEAPTAHAARGMRSRPLRLGSEAVSRGSREPV